MQKGDAWNFKSGVGGAAARVGRCLRAIDDDAVFCAVAAHNGRFFLLPNSLFVCCLNMNELLLMVAVWSFVLRRQCRSRHKQWVAIAEFDQRGGVRCHVVHFAAGLSRQQVIDC